jgi:hypothetical protein
VRTEGDQSTGDGGNNTEAQPLGGTTQAMPTPDEAERASEMWGTVQGKEEAEESLHKCKELHREAMADLKPHQLEMACQFWVLASMGITMPEEDAGNEEWGPWDLWWNWNEGWRGQEEWCEPRGSQWNWKENGNKEEVEYIRVGQQVNKAWGHGGAEEDEEGGNWADEKNNVEGVEEEEEWEEGESEAEEQRIIDEGEQWTEEEYAGEEDGESWEDGGWDHDEEDNGSGDWNGEDSNEEDDEEGWEEHENEEDGGEWDEEEDEW